MVAAVSQTSDLSIPCLNRSPVVAVAAATCLRKGLLLAAIPHAFEGKRSNLVNL